MPGEAGYRKLIAFARSLDGEVRIVYEAGPCGYELYRRLTKAGLSCQVAAPSLTPRKPGDKVKTNRRDAFKLARYLRSGDLTFITVPDRERESLRDLVRARHAVMADLVSIQHQITQFLLRYGHRYRDGTAWTTRFSFPPLGVRSSMFDLPATGQVRSLGVRLRCSSLGVILGVGSSMFDLPATDADGAANN